VSMEDTISEHFRQYRLMGAIRTPVRQLPFTGFRERILWRVRLSLTPSRYPPSSGDSRLCLSRTSHREAPDER
jgi:hypothetical protein